MSRRLSFLEHIRRGSFRSERHADLLATSPPLPQECPVPSVAFPALAFLWSDLVRLQAAAAEARSSEEGADIAADFGRESTRAAQGAETAWLHGRPRRHCVKGRRCGTGVASFRFEVWIGAEGTQLSSARRELSCRPVGRLGWGRTS